MKRLATFMPRLRPDQMFRLIVYSYWLRFTSLLETHQRVQHETGACAAPPIVQ